jgi:hypothetical protein
MVYWESLTNWSLAVNIDNLVASIPFPLAKWKTVEVETFLLSSQGSRIVNIENSSTVHSFLVRALNLQILKTRAGKYAQDRSKLYATLLCVAIANIKRGAPSFSRFAPHYGRLIRPLSLIVISVTVIQCHDVALPLIFATVFTTPRSRELTLLSAVLSTPDTRLGQLTVTVPHRL